MYKRIFPFTRHKEVKELKPLTITTNLIVFRVRSSNLAKSLIANKVTLKYSSIKTQTQQPKVRSLGIVTLVDIRCHRGGSNLAFLSIFQD